MDNSATTIHENYAVADALRRVAARLQLAIENGKRSIDAEDLLQTVLAIADELDADP